MRMRVIIGDPECHCWLLLMRIIRNKLVVEREIEGS